MKGEPPPLPSITLENWGGVVIARIRSSCLLSCLQRLESKSVDSFAVPPVPGQERHVEGEADPRDCEIGDREAPANVGQASPDQSGELRCFVFGYASWFSGTLQRRRRALTWHPGRREGPGYSRVRNQLNIAKRGASEEEVLLRR